MKRKQYPSVISSRPQQPDEVTAAEAAELLGVSKAAIATAVSLGRLPSRLIERPDGRASKGLRVIRRADLETYRAQKSRGPR